MAKKVSKNSRVGKGQRTGGTGRDYVKVVKSIKDPETGKYTYQEVMVHKDNVKEFLAKK
ncbi:MAG TPA: DUF4295 domain-containing protein [Saprospiraceae bacterium]|nr:DUF4295 domain-containing protein [Saprospiraceae bacterium]